jgi:hypothetical protein
MLPLPVPYWDEEHHVLYWQGEEVKAYQQDADAQETLLNAFQKAAWVREIPNPYTYLPNKEARECLHNACKNLNRAQQVVRLHVRRKGAWVRWEPVA